MFNDLNHNGIPDSVEFGYAHKYHTAQAALAAARRRQHDAAVRAEQITRLNEYRDAVALQHAENEARANALREAEHEQRMREASLYKMQLDEYTAASRVISNDLRVLKDNIKDITTKLATPKSVIPVTAITSCVEHDTFYRLTTSDDRIIDISKHIINEFIEPYTARTDKSIKDMRDVQVNTFDNLRTEFTKTRDLAASAISIANATNADFNELNERVAFTNDRADLLERRLQVLETYIRNTQNV